MAAMPEISNVTLRESDGRPEPSPDDLACVARVRKGDETAAQALVQRLYPTVMKLVCAHLPRRTTAEDLAQVVFLKVFKKLDQFSGLVPLEHWVSRIAINTCLNELRQERQRPELRMSDFNEQEQAVIQQLVSSVDELPLDQSAEAREVLEKLLAELTPDERMVVSLLHLEERSTHQISQLTGWSVSRVKVKAFRARHKMRKLWQHLAESENRRYSLSLAAPSPFRGRSAAPQTA
jgi:RNA polymerase sigma-70 factor (ECF subfamily)